MSVLQPKTSKTLLESAATRLFNDKNRLAYAHIGPDLTVVQTSDNFSFLLPEGMETAEGRDAAEVVGELAGAADMLRAVLHQGQEEYVLDLVKRETAGGVLYLNFRIANLQPLTGETGLLLLVENVTPSGILKEELARQSNDLQRAQVELAQLEQFKSFLLSMLAHDMQTPLAAIRGYSELLLRLINSNNTELISAKSAAFAGNICTITDQMTWLIRDIIDWSLAENDGLSVKVESCDLHQVIEETLDMMYSIIKLQNIALTLELNPPELLVSADSQRMRQITNNLIGHAIKNTPNGGEITITTHKENSEAVLVVADNGRGLTPEQMDKIFQPYYRADENKSSNIFGAGLGLHIVKVLVEAHNGRVEVASEVGRGTEFTVYLPLA